ncbi:MAG: thioredoxin [Anaerolineae bacterium]|nr:thioredoxin [Anaerolineae bacterium]
MAKPVDVTDASFAQDVEKSEQPVLVDFWAPWCGPCLMLAPTVEQIAQEQEGRLKVVKLNVDENPQTATRFRVMSIPTLVLFKDGQPVERLVGAMPKSGILSQLQKHL